jgi:GNAT superfamily N-acetyltransferase
VPDRIDRAEAIGRATQFLRRSLELTADSVRELDAGLLARTPSLPLIWSLNHLRLLVPVPWRKALTLADQHLAHVRFRHLIAEGSIARRWAGAPLQAGFQVEREVMMVMAGEAPGRAAREPGPEVVEPDEAAMLRLLKRWHEEEGRVGSECEQLLEAAAREGRARGERRLGIAGANGELLAMTKLYADGRTAQVEDVYTVPEARGRGFARALVSHAIELARRGGNQVTLITADEDDWPKHLYARLGFQPAVVTWAFHREQDRGPPG